MSSTIQTLSLKPIVEGDYWEQPITFTKDGFDFTDCVVECKLRSKSTTGEVAHIFDMSLEAVSVGLAESKLQLIETETAALGVGHYYGDVVISRANPVWGPFTPFRFKLAIETRITK